DQNLAEQWIPPSWLWRILDFNGKREGPKPHSRDSAKRELAYIHWQLWEAIEDAIRSAQSGAKLAQAIRAVKKPRKKSREDKYRDRHIEKAIREGYTGEKFCKYLDDWGVKALPEWKDWPGSWLTAYRGQFAKRIQDLKNR